MEFKMDVPRNKLYPSSAGQCDECGGHGCSLCSYRGWHHAGSVHIRLCLREGCGHAMSPSQTAMYCSVKCAVEDA